MVITQPHKGLEESEEYPSTASQKEPSPTAAVSVCPPGGRQTCH